MKSAGGLIVCVSRARGICRVDYKISQLLETAVAKRAAVKRYTNALRLVNGPGDDLKGLVLEQYDRHFVAQIFDERWLKEREALSVFVQTRCQGKYLVIKDRTQSRAAQPEAFRSSVWLSGEPSTTTVQEYGLHFGVDLNDTLNTGLFLDMRRNRKMVAEAARGRKVLNCFAYTCSFGVHCRAAGVLSVVNVDISAKNLLRGRANYALNGLVAAENEFVRADAVSYLQRALVKQNFFDLIILDPPSFARYDGRAFSVKKDFAPLIAAALKVLSPGGILLAATNFSGFTPGHIEDMVRAARPARPIKEIQSLGQDEDFVGSGLTPESYLAAVLVRFCNG